MDGESVGEVIRRLRFVSSPAPAVYLNENLVREAFIGNLGAIESFTRSAEREVSAGIKSVIELGGGRATQEQVAYDLRDPLTQALVLHTALGAQEAVGPPAPGAGVGAFVEVVGAPYFPGRAELTPPPAGLEPAAQALQRECERQTQVARAFAVTAGTFLPLLIAGADVVCGSVIDAEHLRPTLAASYLTFEQMCFGLMERVVDDLPLFTLLYMRAHG